MFSLLPRKPWIFRLPWRFHQLRLACVLVERGAFAEAEPLQHRALEGIERLLGPEHRDTLTELGNLAEVLRSLGKFREALLRAASSHSRVAFCGGKSWEKICRETINAFSDRLRFLHTQIISHHL